MSIIRNTIAGVSAALLAATPIMAQTAPDRATAPSEEDERVFGGNLLVSLLVIVGVIAAIIIVVGNEDDEPVSP